MDLLCLEKIVENRQSAELDPTIYRDPRVLKNMLHLEPAYLVKEPYFGTVQPDILPYMRKTITMWMLEVCEHQCCEEQVFPLAVNFFDRFLAVCQIKSNQMQLVAAASLLLASKDCEMLLLWKLHWEVCAITGFDFVDHVMQNLHFSISSDLLRAHTLTLLALAYTEADLICVKGSVLSSAALIAAARGLKLRPDALNDVCLLTKCDPALVESTIARLEMCLAEEAANISYPRRKSHCM